jgi:hypothetical protein
MGAEGSTESQWEVLGWDHPREGLVPYRPPADDSSDGITFHGEAKVLGNRDWGRLGTAIYGAVGTGFFCWMASIRIEWLFGAVVILLTCVASILMNKPEKRISWSAPEVTVDREGMAMSDVDGVAHSATWSELGDFCTLSIDTMYGKEVHLTWVTPENVHVTANLGDSINLWDLRRAITSRAPKTMTLHLGEHKACRDD